MSTKNTKTKKTTTPPSIDRLPDKGLYCVSVNDMEFRNDSTDSCQEARVYDSISSLIKSEERESDDRSEIDGAVIYKLVPIAEIVASETFARPL